MDQYNWADPPSRTAFPVAGAGYPFIAAGAFVTLVLALLELTALALIALVATLFVCYFFRDPDRVTPNQPTAVIAPADGRVVSAQVVDSNAFVEGRCMKVGIFMSIFNVHVNRIPFVGRVKAIRYTPGRFYSADKEKAATDNEHNAVIMTAGGMYTIAVVQVAGLVARRIICWIKEEDTMAAGQRFGLICFGSRVDLYLPAETDVAARVGDKVKAGSTILGYLPDDAG
ncbi:MAG: phosphatidylserine decarboxylase family protein [Thermodesulfobacteriota bacterium]